MRSGGGFAFGPFQLATASLQLRRNGEPVSLTPRQAAVLYELVSTRGDVVSKQRISEVGWGVAAISDSSIEKLFSQLRTILDRDHRSRYVVNFARQGYRMAEPVTDIAPDVDLAEALAPYRAYVEGRALLEAFERSRLEPARAIFDALVRRSPHDAMAHVGLANAEVMLFESTRAEPAPDTAALTTAISHAELACRLAPRYAEAWSTLGFVLERRGDRLSAVSALWRAVTLEPDNWLHWLRLTYGTWGQDRLRAAHETLKLMPGLPAAHAMKAMVFIARGAFDLAEADVLAGVESMAGGTIAPPAAPLHWLDGLLCLARERTGDAHAAFDRELERKDRGHLYASEVCAQVWYAKGASRYVEGDTPAAQAAFAEVFTRVPHHPLARAGMVLVEKRLGRTASGSPLDDSCATLGFEREMAQAALLVDDGKHDEAAARLNGALELAPPGNSGWSIPVDPLLKVQANKAVWRHTLARLQQRACRWLPPATA